MARRSLPESLELLLDTMCNTFGGVMFIAISMVVTLMISRQLLTPERQREAEERRLEACRRENARLREQVAAGEKHLFRLRQEAGKITAPAAESELPAVVARLEQELRGLSRQLERLADAVRALEARTARSKRDNALRAEKLENSSLELVRRKAALEAENRRLVQELDALRAALAKIPVKQINFARNERTNKQPYLVIVRDNWLYRVGAPPLQSTPEVAVRRDGNAILLTPLRGEALVAADRGTFTRLCRDFSEDSHFLWIMVDRGSLGAFVPFRRLLRDMGCQVYWYVNRNNIVYLGGNGYSASK